MIRNIAVTALILLCFWGCEDRYEPSPMAPPPPPAEEPEPWSKTYFIRADTYRVIIYEDEDGHAIHIEARLLRGRTYDEITFMALSAWSDSTVPPTLDPPVPDPGPDDPDPEPSSLDATPEPSVG